MSERTSSLVSLNFDLQDFMLTVHLKKKFFLTQKNLFQNIAL